MKSKLVIILVLLAALGLGAALTLYLVEQGVNLGNEEPYYAVQMENGDLYFGKITRFPNFKLRDAYIPQSFSDPTNPLGSSLRVTPLNQASIWQASEIQLNRDKILSISKVDPGSQVMQSIKEQ